MSENLKNARQIIFDFYLSGNLFALFGYIIFSSNKEVDKTEKDEFKHHVLDLLLNKADKEPEKIIELYRKDEIGWWVRALIRHQLWNPLSKWHRWNSDKRLLLCGSYEELINQTERNQYGQSKSKDPEFFRE